MRKYKFFCYVIIFISLILLNVFFQKNVLANNMENRELDNDYSIKYTTHVQGLGWQKEMENGEMAGTTGEGLRLEAIKIDAINAPENVKIKYKVHVEGIGWQNWKTNGEIAGTTGRGLRLEAINIKLENTEEYSIKYRVHVQNIGWQDWRYDGETAGTEGKSLRLEAIEIKIEPKTERGILKIETPTNNNEINSNKLKLSGWCMSNTKNDSIKTKIDNEYVTSNISRKYRSDVLGTLGGYGGPELNPNAGYETEIDLTDKEDGKHKVKVELYSESGILLSTNEIIFNIDRSLKPKYSAHVQNIGWQDWKSNGQMAGTTLQGLRIEALQIQLLNAPENAKINYQLHVQNIGWQNWKENGQMAGTTGLGYRLEAIKINLENLSNYSVMYRVHVQNIGWQDWRYDGELAGTTGLAYRLEAIQIKIIPKVDKGIIKIETPTNNNEINSNKLKLSGWCMSNTKNDSIKIKVDGSEINPNISRIYRSDVLGILGGYGGSELNPNAGYETEIDLTNFQDGIRTIKVELYSENNKLLDTNQVTINLDRSMKVLYSAHVQNIGWTNWVKNDEISGTVGEELRLEAIQIKLLNTPDNVGIEYNVHVQNIGWQGWKRDGEIAGTTGQDLRIEAIEIRLVDKNTNKEVDNMTVSYQSHIQGIGWQREKVDGETSGTTGQELRIEALKIKLINTKLPRGMINIEKPTRTVFTGDSITIYGWEMSTQSDDSVLEVLIDGRSDNLSINRTQRDDVIASMTFYGEKDVNPNPGFEFTLYFSNYTDGQHTITINLYSKDKTRLLDTKTKNIQIVKNKYFGVDVSTHQGNINWNSVKQEGVNYAIIRIGWVGNVTNKKDAFFEANYNSCQGNGIPMGIYVYSYSTSVQSAINEANLVLSWLDNRSLRLPIFWDVEDSCQQELDRNTLTAMADAFCSTIESRGYQAGIYSSKWWLTSKLNMNQLENKYDVWVAQYNSECTYEGRYDIWQYSSEGRLSGISGNVDSNWFYKKY